MSKHLQEAIDNLEIDDVYQHSLVAMISPGFEPKYFDVDDLEVHFLHTVHRSEVLELVNGGDSVKFFRVTLALGVRWVMASESEKGDEAEGEKEPEELAKIEGRMVAQYIMKKDISMEAMSEFAKRNASYHVWPYWREIVSSQCCKMNLPKVTLQTIQVVSNRDAVPEPEGSGD